MLTIEQLRDVALNHLMAIRYGLEDGYVVDRGGFGESLEGVAEVIAETLAAMCDKRT